jgi:heme-degrading monooxygenase HmoA
MALTRGSDQAEQTEPRHHLRLNRFTGFEPAQLVQLLEDFTDDQLPRVTVSPGFRTMFVALDLKRGRAAAATFWESAAALKRHDPLEEQARTLALAHWRGSPVNGMVDRYGIIFEDRPTPTGDSSAAARAARLTRWEGVAPSRISDSMAQFEAEELAELKATPGYRGLFVAVNQQLGNTMSVTLWDTREDLAQSLGWEREARRRVERGGAVPRAVFADSYDVALAPSLRRLAPPPAWHTPEVDETIAA